MTSHNAFSLRNWKQMVVLSKLFLRSNPHQLTAVPTVEKIVVILYVYNSDGVESCASFTRQNVAQVDSTLTEKIIVLNLLSPSLDFDIREL